MTVQVLCVCGDFEAQEPLSSLSSQFPPGIPRRSSQFHPSGPSYSSAMAQVLIGNCLLGLLIFFSCLRFCLPYFVTVDAHAEECFFDKVQNGTKMSLTFEVIEGGFLDIDVRVHGPDNEEIISKERESNGKITFAAGKTGAYTYCFSNKMSTMTPKGVMFSMDIGETHAAVTQADGENHPNKLAEMIKELSTSLVGVKHEQEYMEVRDKIHRKINESTNTRVVMWSFFEAVVLVAMTVGQVYYLKRFFEVRRVV